jgi:hypothetical protein
MNEKPNADNTEAATLIRQLREECAQIFELTVEENGLIHQLCEMMTDVQSFFKIGVELPTTMFPSTGKIDKVILSMNGDVVIERDGHVDAQHLSKYDSPTVVGVMKEAAKKITDYAKRYREDIVNRIDLLEKLARELKKLQDIKKVGEEDKAQQDQFLIPEISSEDLEPAT